jgi:chloramphenicol O-acetyltransferase type A
MMRIIDFQTWPRRKHFEIYNSYDHPHFSMCANVDLTIFYPFVKQNQISITVAIVYLIAKTANAIPEFRYRIRPEAVVEHELVHPSTTVMADNDLFAFCWLDYSENFPFFYTGALERIATAKSRPSLEDIPGRDDCLYMTAIPWVSFTSFTHPMHLQPPDSVPRFAWGKFFQQAGRLWMPLGVQAHHALMDGFHFGKFYSTIQEHFSHPKNVLEDR